MFEDEEKINVEPSQIQALKESMFPKKDEALDSDIENSLEDLAITTLADTRLGEETKPTLDFISEFSKINTTTNDTASLKSFPFWRNKCQ